MRHVGLLVLLLVAGCGASHSTEPAQGLSAPAVPAPTAAPTVPAAVASPLAVGATATLSDTDPNDGTRQSETITLDSATIISHTDAENVTKPYLVVTITEVCQTGPCTTGPGAFTVHQDDGTRVEAVGGILDTGELAPGVILQTGEKIKGAVSYDAPKTGMLVYAPHDATTATWALS